MKPRGRRTFATVPPVIISGAIQSMVPTAECFALVHISTSWRAFADPKSARSTLGRGWGDGGRCEEGGEERMKRGGKDVEGEEEGRRYTEVPKQQYGQRGTPSPCR